VSYAKCSSKRVHVGNGTYEGGRLNFVVSATMPLTPADRQRWRALFNSSSDVLYRATGGQVCFGTIGLTDNSGAIRSAEVLLYPDNRLAGGTKGFYGVVGHAISMPLGEIGDPRIFVHEICHHLWNLGDEYAGAMENYALDFSSASPNRSTILLQSVIPQAPLPGDDVILLLGGIHERRSIATVNATTIVVSAPFSDLPSRSQSSGMTLQRSVGMSCGVPDVVGASHCLMSQFRGPAGSGTADFCDGSNHTFSTLTDQQSLHSQSCWETIVSRPGYTGLTISPGVQTGQPPAINFIDLAKEARFVLAIDKSGSMQGDQLAFAQEAAKFWKDICTLAGDRLSIIAFNSRRTVVLPLTPMSTIGNQAQLNADIDALRAVGRTNIRDALFEGVNQITSTAGRAELQAMVLLTDGVHNNPAGSRLTEAISSLRSEGIFASVVAIGDDTSIDVADLDQLALETGGTRAITDPAHPSSMEAALIEANLQLRGGVVTVSLEDFVPAPPADKQQPKLDQLYKRANRPELVSVLAAIGINSLQPTARQQEAAKNRMRLSKFQVERDCDALNSTVSYPFNCDFDLFLLGPGGQEYLPRRSNSADGKTYSLLRVENPEPGSWRCFLIARQLPQQPCTTTLLIGAENRKLQVAGGVTSLSHRQGRDIEVFASARWERPLTDLKVRAELLRGPTVQQIALRDGELLSSTAGNYRGSFANLKAGHYRGRIVLEQQRVSRWADNDHALTHSRVDSIGTESTAPPFQREIPIHFHVK
jgi:von Willebrand factor type A domain